MALSQDDFDEGFESPDELVSSALAANKRFRQALRNFYRDTKMEYAEDWSVLPGGIVYRFSIQGKPPISLRREAYHVVSDLRNALDQSVFAASRLLGGNPKKPRVYFPFALNPSDFETLYVSKKGRCCETHPDLVPVLRDLAPWPFHKETMTGNDAFRALGKISGPNKHQVIIEFAPELIQARENSRPSGFVDVHMVPPVRLDKFNEHNGRFYIPETRGRTDFIAAITPVNTRFEIDADVIIALIAKEVSSPRITIEKLLDEFIGRTQFCVKKVKDFVQLTTAA